MANSGAYPVDPTTDVGKVRILVGDTDPTNIIGVDPAQTGDYLWYSDVELASLLSTLATDPAHGAIFVLRMVAMTPAMQLKKWQSADLAVDGPAITTAIRQVINDIEKGITAAATVESQDYFGIVNTGLAIGGPQTEPWYTRPGNWHPFADLEITVTIEVDGATATAEGFGF